MVRQRNTHGVSGTSKSSVEILLAEDVPALNRQLKAAAVPELNPSSGPNQPDDLDLE